jgi:hypothetical protein
MSMGEKYLAAVLAKILVEAGVASRQILSELLGLFRNRAIIVPYPGYGNIVHDLPDDYCFPGMKKIFDEGKSNFLKFYTSNLESYFNHHFLNEVPDSCQNELDFFWDNVYFPSGDARTLYAMLAYLNPSKMIEVGVGNSTKMARKSIGDFSLRTKIISIDPTPRANINGITDVHLQESVTDVDLKLFDTLRAGDILFIDGSHVSHCGTDVPHYSLNILPRLKSGVYVHIHDIFLPWEYYEDFRIRHYNEQHVVGAFVSCSACWEIVFPVHYMNREGVIPYGGGSLWMLKK